MKFRSKKDAKKIIASKECVIWEYPLGTDSANGAVAEINGRYPKTGYAKNTVSQELVYVIAGKGVLEFIDREVQLAKGDVALIEAGEAFAWQGKNLEVFIPCFPAWRPEQHEAIEVKDKDAS